MSILDAINDLDGTELFLLTGEFPDEETPRTIYVSKEVATLLFGELGDSHEDQRASIARAVLDDFVQGGWITIGEDPHDKAATAIMARVAPVEAEIFDFRCLDPMPGIRILGCFAGPDTFIALTWDYRENFDDAWPEHVEQAEAEWKRLFGEIPPHKGKLPDDYVSFNAKVV